MGKKTYTAPPAAMPILSSDACPECGHDVPGAPHPFRDFLAKLHLPAPKVRCRFEEDDVTGWGAPECPCPHPYHG
jgi:hypothetical protein